MRVVAVGDSITFGQYVDPGLAWPAQLGIVGRGVCGETTRQALERFPQDVQARPADVTILQWGLNDSNRWQTDGGLPRVSLDAYEANLVEMVHRCRVFGTVPMLCTVTPSWASDDHGDDVAEYSAAVERVADQLDVALIDVRAVFLARADGGRALLMGDGIHLTVEGHRRYANVVRASLRRGRVAA